MCLIVVILPSAPALVGELRFSDLAALSPLSQPVLQLQSCLLSCPALPCPVLSYPVPSRPALFILSRLSTRYLERLQTKILPTALPPWTRRTCPATARRSKPCLSPETSDRFSWRSLCAIWGLTCEPYGSRQSRKGRSGLGLLSTPSTLT